MNIEEGRTAYIELWGRQAKLQYIGDKILALERLEFVLPLLKPSTVEGVAPVWLYEDAVTLRWAINRLSTTGEYRILANMDVEEQHYRIKTGEQGEDHYTITTDPKVAAMVINEAIAKKEEGQP